MGNRFEEEQPFCPATGNNVLLLCGGSPRPPKPPPRQGPDGRSRTAPPAASSPAEPALQRLAGPACRAAINHISLTALAIANITSGILVANQNYDRLPGPLILCVFLSFICASLQGAGKS